jgi:hypothetical protein
MLVANAIHPRGGQDWSAADAHAAMEEYGAPADVLGYGIHDAVKLPDWNRLSVFDGKVEVVHPSPLRFDRNLTKGDDRVDAVRVPLCQPLGISEAPEEKAFPYSRHWAPSSPCFLLQVTGVAI